MHKRRLAIIAAILSVSGMILFITASRSRSPEFYARSLLNIEIKGTTYSPNFRTGQVEVISNFLSSSESRLILAKTSGIDEKSFRLKEIGLVGGSGFVRIDYSGTDSDSVQSVASNAANMVVSFYNTNQPSWAVTNIDSRPFTPISFSERLEDSAASTWQRFKNSIHW